ncbi:hypothetical protein ACVINH_000535 [Rhizobium anhuiense]
MSRSAEAESCAAAPYSLDEFASKYGLLSDQAESLFTRFGPSSIELDLLMAAKRRSPVLPDRIAE